jgi:hypothetical protein
MFEAKIRAIYGLKTKNALFGAFLAHKTIRKSQKIYIKSRTPKMIKSSWEFCTTRFTSGGPDGGGALLQVNSGGQDSLELVFCCKRTSTDIQICLLHFTS